jgi:hypothetical protein
MQTRREERVKKMKRHVVVALVATALLVLGAGLSSTVDAQLSAFPGSKTLNSGPDPVGLGKATPTTFVYTINLDANFDNTEDVEDVVPAEFDVSGGLCTAPLANLGDACVTDANCDTSLGSGDGICGASLLASCGSAVSAEVNKPGDKLRPDVITWSLDGCDEATSQTLMVRLQTDQNPGHGKRDIAFFEPTSCGPLSLNDGAVVIDPATGDPLTEPSNSLTVATCPLEGDAGCVDADNDGWSVACGDTVDNDNTVFPGAPELCDGKDNDLNPSTVATCQCNNGADDDLDTFTDSNDPQCSGPEDNDESA